MSNVSMSKAVNNEESKNEDAELGLYLLRVVENFRSIEKKIFAKQRNRDSIKQLFSNETNGQYSKLSKFYDQLMNKDEIEAQDFMDEEVI